MCEADKEEIARLQQELADARLGIADLEERLEQESNARTYDGERYNRGLRAAQDTARRTREDAEYRESEYQDTARRLARAREWGNSYEEERQLTRLKRI
jgi:hypothetical protein